MAGKKDKYALDANIVWLYDGFAVSARPQAIVVRFIALHFFLSEIAQIPSPIGLSS